MKIHRSFSSIIKPPDGCVLAIGNFDGVHLGHQRIISTARALADQHKLPLFALTFYPAPIKILRPELAPRIITPIETKVHYLQKSGIDELMVVQTNKSFLQIEAEDFIKDIIAGVFNARHVVEGESFNFGRKRKGSLDSLKQLGKDFQYEAHQPEAKTILVSHLEDPITISSTFIRQQISDSKFDDTKRCLGRHYNICGRVVTGHKRGRTIGFPTANLQTYHQEQLICHDGVYAGWATIGDTVEEMLTANRRYMSAISIGEAATFSDAKWQLEAHFIDFKGTHDCLYGKHISMTMIKKIRRLQKFDDVDALVKQITLDCELSTSLLSSKGQ
jgi:riboflavin kinase/FMN adenylyltransferase